MGHNPPLRRPRPIDPRGLAFVRATLMRRQAYFDRLADRLAELGHYDSARRARRAGTAIRVLRESLPPDVPYSLPADPAGSW